MEEEGNILSPGERGGGWLSSNTAPVYYSPSCCPSPSNVKERIQEAPEEDMG